MGHPVAWHQQDQAVACAMASQQGATTAARSASAPLGEFQCGRIVAVTELHRAGRVLAVMLAARHQQVLGCLQVERHKAVWLTHGSPRTGTGVMSPSSSPSLRYRRQSGQQLPKTGDQITHLVALQRWQGAGSSSIAPHASPWCENAGMSAGISDEEFAARFEAARKMCFTGHDAGCTYGGLTPAGGYWLAADGCPLDHGDMCAVCSSESEARFGDWASRDGALLIWGVWLCAACRDRELALNSEKWRWVHAAS